MDPTHFALDFHCCQFVNNCPAGSVGTAYIAGAISIRKVCHTAATSIQSDLALDCWQLHIFILISLKLTIGRLKVRKGQVQNSAAKVLLLWPLTIWPMFNPLALTHEMVCSHQVGQVLNFLYDRTTDTTSVPPLNIFHNWYDSVTVKQMTFEHLLNLISRSSHLHDQLLLYCSNCHLVFEVSVYSLIKELNAPTPFSATA